ncbi:MAG: hypothetical protein NT028_09025 [candidate division Zixibacteria bacterium]|nr:hypothetical protein [candidate division Zixibacteria bacterium]
MYRVNLPVVLMAITCLVSALPDSPAHSSPLADLSLSIETGKSTYLTGEGIDLKVLVTNRTSDTVSVMNLDLGDSYFSITLWDATGKSLRIKGPRGHSIEGLIGSWVIQPGESLAGVFGLDGIFGDLPRKSLTPMLPPGSYQAQAVYRHWWRDQYISNKISFRVTEPVGPEREAFDLWREAETDYLGGQTENGIECLRKFFALHAESNYAAATCHLAMFIDKQHGSEWAEKLIREYPTSMYFEGALGRLAGAGVNPSEREQRQRDLLAKYKGTLTGALIEKAISKGKEREKNNALLMERWKAEQSIRDGVDK